MMRSVFRDMRMGQTLSVVVGDERISITLEEKSGQKAKLRFEMDETVVIERSGREQPVGQTGFKQAQLGIKIPA